MINSELIQYIKTRRSQGIPDDQIYQELQKQGWQKRDLVKLLSPHLAHSRSRQFFYLLQHTVANKWILALIAIVFIAGIGSVYLFIIVPYSELHDTINTMQKLSSVQYTGKTAIALPTSHHATSVTLSFHGVAEFDTAPSQTHTTISAESHGLSPDFQGTGEITRQNETLYLNIHKLQHVPLVDPTSTFNHWYIVSSDSAHLTSIQQIIPDLFQKHLVTITHSSTENNLQRLDFHISKNQLQQFATTRSLNHIDGSLWIDKNHYLKRIVFSMYKSQSSKPSIKSDISFSQFNKSVTIHQPSQIVESESGTSIYYLLKIIQSILSS